MVRPFYWFAIITGIPTFWPFFRTKVYYEDPKVQKRHIKGSALVVSNHLQLFDYVVEMFVFKSRIVRGTAAEVMFGKNIVLDGIMNGLGMIKVDRKTKDREWEKTAVNVLKKGGVIQICPESRMPQEGDERPLPFKKSFVYIALESKAPIIPVYVNGENFSKKRARVVIGKPIDLASMYDESLDEKTNVDNMTELVRNKIIALGEMLNG